MRTASASLLWMLLTPVIVSASDLAVLQSVDRHIAKEPRYVASRPLYGLLVLGPAAGHRVWMVLDHSKPEAEIYDVIYVDLNGNGDLTEPTERVVGNVLGNTTRFRFPDLEDPVTGAVHSEFTARFTGAPALTIMVSLTWQGRLKMGGGYPQDPEDGYLKVGDKPANAPVMWANGDSPYRFQRWYGGKLAIGGENDFRVFVGQPGGGRTRSGHSRNTFCRNRRA